MSRSQRSQVWLHHFQLVEENRAKCNYCSKIIQAKGNSTSPLLRHLRAMHITVPLSSNVGAPQVLPPENRSEIISDLQVILPNENQEQPSTSVTATSSSRPQVKTGGSAAITNYFLKPMTLTKRMDLDESLVRMIARECYPLRIVEGAEFKSFVQKLCPTYQLPNRKTIRNSLLPAMYNKTVEKVKIEVGQAQAVCITMDSWTSAVNECYIAITAHWLTPSLQLHSALVSCEEFTDRHTTANISRYIVKMSTKWEFTNKIAAVVTDHAPNMLAAVRDANLRSLGCFAHALNLAAKHALECVKDVTDHVSKIVRFFKKSTLAAEELKKVQRQKGEAELKLKQDCPTRWNSTFLMLERLLQLKDAVVTVLSAMLLSTTKTVTEVPDLPNRESWTIIEETAKAMQILNVITTEISSEKHVSSSKVSSMLVTSLSTRIIKIIPMVMLLTKRINKLLATGTWHPKVSHLLRTLNAQIKERFQRLEDSELLAQCTLLDPRFKTKGFLNKEKAQSAVIALKRKAAAMHTIEISEDSTEVTANQENQSAYDELWSEFDNEVSAARGSQSSSSVQAIIEVDKYLEETIISRDQNPLLWWQYRRGIYPKLVKVVEKRLCIPATSVPCERIFSKTGQIINERRTRLDPSTVEQLIFLQHNL